MWFESFQQFFTLSDFASLRFRNYNICSGIFANKNGRQN